MIGLQAFRNLVRPPFQFACSIKPGRFPMLGDVSWQKYIYMGTAPSLWYWVRWSDLRSGQVWQVVLYC